MAFQKEASGQGAGSAGVSDEELCLPEAAEDSATRALCLAVHLNQKFRDEVCENTLPAGLEAGCPSFGVDMVAVWRHACLARDRRRDAARALDVVRVVLGLSLAVAVFGVTAPLYLSPQWLWSCAAAVVAGAAAVVHGGRVVRATVRDTLATATKLRRPDIAPLTCAPEQDAADEKRIEEIQNANLVVFSARSATPFIGSGFPVEHVVMAPVDISRGTSREVEPLPFAAHDVHDRLVAELPSRGLDSVIVGQRLHIRGDVIAATARGPWENREEPPPCRVSPQWLEAGVDRPTGRARTYVCLQRRFDGGRLVVSMFVRVSREGNMLSLEIAAYVLADLDPWRVQLDDPFQDHFDAHLDPRPGSSPESACDQIADQLLERYLTRGSWEPRQDTSGTDDGADGDAREPRTGRARSEGVWKEQTDEIERSAALGRRIHDFGAETSLREWAARPLLASYFEANDAQDCLQRMQRSVIDCLEKFLTERQVDTSEFRTRRDQIFNNTTYQIHRVEKSNLGPNGKVINDESGQPKHQRPTGPGTEQPPGHTD